MRIPLLWDRIYRLQVRLQPTSYLLPIRSLHCSLSRHLEMNISLLDKLSSRLIFISRYRLLPRFLSLCFYYMVSNILIHHLPAISLVSVTVTLYHYSLSLQHQITKGTEIGRRALSLTTGLETLPTPPQNNLKISKIRHP